VGALAGGGFERDGQVAGVFAGEVRWRGEAEDVGGFVLLRKFLLSWRRVGRQRAWTSTAPRRPTARRARLRKRVRPGTESTASKLEGGSMVTHSFGFDSDWEPPPRKTVVLRTMPTSQNRDMGHPDLWRLGNVQVS